MLERGNKFKPIFKKQVPLTINMSEDTNLTQESKLSSSSQNKLFIRKPVRNRNGFVSPTFKKNRVSQNEEVKSPTFQTTGKKWIQSDSGSDHDYWDGKNNIQFSTKLSFKKNVSIQKSQKPDFTKQNYVQVVNETYFGNESHALTEIGEHYQVQTIKSDICQKDLFPKQNMKRDSKQNMVANSINLNCKKVTRTEYFPNLNHEEVSSILSCSLKQKQLNFNLLRHSVNNNIEAYVLRLEETIRMLEKNIYTLTKKCNWMHEEVQMHLQKQHLINAEKNVFDVELITKAKEIQKLVQENSKIKKQLDELKLHLESKELLKKYKSFKDLQTFSSLKQLCSNNQEIAKVSKVQQNLQGYFGMMPSSLQKNKKKSFRTYPGVFSPRKFRVNDSNYSSMIGNSENSQQNSILNEKFNIKNEQNESKYSTMIEDLKKQRDEFKASFQSLITEINLSKQKNVQKLNQKIQYYEEKIYEQSKMYDQLKSDFDILKGQKEKILIELDKIHFDYKRQIENLTQKIKNLESQISLQQKSKIYQTVINFEEENKLKSLVENSNKSKNFGQSSDTQKLEHQNKYLRTQIQKIMEQYKYIKIQNRMLLKIKEDKERLEKEKKQIKDQRNLFKKRLLEILKNKPQLGKQPTKSFRRLLDCGSESSEEDSAVFELSQSEIKVNDESKYEKTQK